MSRNLLAKHKLPDFVQFLRHSNIQYRDGRGDYDVLQVLTPNASWQCIFERHKSTVHYTVAQPLEGIVRQFIAASKIDRQ